MLKTTKYEATKRGEKMKTNIRDNNDINIKRISIDGMNMKELLNDEFVEKLDENIGNYTLYGLSIILDGEKPSSVVSVSHTLGGDYKKNILTVSAESEENLTKFLELI